MGTIAGSMRFTVFILMIIKIHARKKMMPELQGVLNIASGITGININS